MNQKQEEKDFKFPPIQNGVDYLHNVVGLILSHEETPEPRNLKYVILHLHAAVEVLLKNRLLREGWELLFENPEEISQERYLASDFRSVGVNLAIKKLRDEAGIQIRSRDKNALGRLTKSRNALQHWGYEASTNAIESQALKVLEFLMSFLYSELLDGLEYHEKKLIGEQVEWIKQGTKKISGFMEERRKRVEPERDAAREDGELVLDCPDCLEDFLVSSGTEHRCLLCPRVFAPLEFATIYMEEFLNTSDHSIIKDGDSDPRKSCPECTQNALLLGALTSESGDPKHACFSCGLTFSDSEIAECWDCQGMFYVDEDSGTICDSCLQGRVNYD